MYDYAIIGAGISGITFARLAQLHNSSFIVLEKENQCGGLCRTINYDDHVLDTGGGHFLCSKYQEVYDFIFSHINKDEFERYDRVSKINVCEHVIDYPLEYNLRQLPRDLQLDLLMSLIEANKNQPKNYLEWMQNNLGHKITDVYLRPYNRKIWGVDPEVMDIDWLSKIPAFSLREVIKAMLTGVGGNMPSHAAFYYPKQGGFQSIFDAIKRPIDNIATSYGIQKLSFDGNKWTINDDISAKVIINTAPWPSLIGALEYEATRADILSLQWSSLVIDLIESEYSHNWHWLYIPDADVQHHREFFIHNFAPHSKCNGVYTECNKTRWKYHNSLYTSHNEYAYPVPIIGHDSTINSILRYYAKNNMYGLGRWGQWKYFNADVCISEAIKLFRAIC